MFTKKTLHEQVAHIYYRAKHFIETMNYLSSRKGMASQAKDTDLQVLVPGEEYGDISKLAPHSLDNSLNLRKYTLLKEINNPETNGIQ